MDPPWQDTPDGRTAPADISPDRHVGAPPDSAAEPLLPAFEPFVEGILAAMPELANEGVRLGLLIFLLGATDRFWLRQGLDDRHWRTYAEALLRRLGTAPERAAELVDAVARLPAGDPGQDVLAQGAATLDDWLSSHNQNTFLVVTEYAPRWRGLGPA